MHLPNPAVVSAFLCEAVEATRSPDEGRLVGSRVVRGAESGRPYLVRRGLLEAVAERIYYEWACAIGVEARPVQFALRSNSQLRHICLLWWADGDIETQAMESSPGGCVTRPEPDTANPLDIPRATALDILLDNSPKSSGWMFEASKVYRLFNYRSVGLGSGIVPFLTRFRLTKVGGISPRLDLCEAGATFAGEERSAFYAEAASLARLPDEVVRRLCTLPEPVGAEAYRLCAGALGHGEGSRDVMKLLLKTGPTFLDEYVYNYVRGRQLVMAAQLKLGRRA